MLRHRDGERRKITELLEVVVYSELGVPGFANELKINFGGMQFNASIDYKRYAQVVIQFFSKGKAALHLNGEFQRREDNGTSVVKFDPLSDQQRQILSRILQQESRHINLFR